MDRILEKIGIYNLLAVLLVGAVNLTLTGLVLKYLYGFTFSPEESTTYNWVLFLVISYVVGLIFQEFGSLFQDICFKNNRMLEKALDTSSNSRVRLTEFELAGIRTYVMSAVGTDDENVVYNYCRYYVMKYCNTTGIDRDQSLSGMSRSLFLYFVFLPTGMLISCMAGCPIANNCLWAIVFLLSVVISILMYRRFVRFAVLRYVNIYRNFYYYAVFGIASAPDMSAGELSKERKKTENYQAAEQKRTSHEME